MTHNSKSFNIAIIGSGVVGEATGAAFIQHGHSVVFVDINPARIEHLNANTYRAYLPHNFPECIPDLFFICTNTPFSSTGFDMAPTSEAFRYCVSKLSPDHFSLIVIRSTVPVGSLDALIADAAAIRPELSVGKDFDVCANPEYLREQHAREDSAHPRSIIIGSTSERSKDMLGTLYAPFGAPMHHLSPNEAQMHKYVHNLFNAQKIAFFNEQRIVCDLLSVDPETIFPLVIESAEASWNPSYGTHDKGPFSGNCLPKDTRGFLNFIKATFAVDLPLLQGVISANQDFADRSTKATASASKRTEEEYIQSADDHYPSSSIA